MKRFISTHSLVLALPMHVDHLPQRGAAVAASTAAAQPGGGYVVLAAAAAQGVPAASASPLGTGPNSFTVRQHLEDAGVEILSAELVGDIGIALQFIEADGSMTSVVTTGVEREPTASMLERISLHDGDLVHISGIDLLEGQGGTALAAWGATIPPDVTVVLSVSPAVEDIPVDSWRQLLPRVDILTMNIREKAALEVALNADEEGLTIRDLLRPEAAIVRRLGIMGCELSLGVGQPRIQIPAYATPLVDTEGVGDTHVATMCASLLKGKSLEEACRFANAASSIVLSHASSLPVPTPEQIEAVMVDTALIDYSAAPETPSTTDTLG